MFIYTHPNGSWLYVKDERLLQFVVEHMGGSYEPDPKKDRRGHYTWRHFIWPVFFEDKIVIPFIREFVPFGELPKMTFTDYERSVVVEIEGEGAMALSDYGTAEELTKRYRAIQWELQ